MNPKKELLWGLWVGPFIGYASRKPLCTEAYSPVSFRAAIHSLLKVWDFLLWLWRLPPEVLLMDKILHDLKDSKLWELWYIPYNG